MKILVMGAGAVGGYFGGRLAAAGEDVTFVCRGETKAAIEREGLKIESVNGDAHTRPRCVEMREATENSDLVLWAVKTYHNSETIPAMKTRIGRVTTVLSLQNGVDAVDELSESFGADRVLPGFAGIAAEVVRPGVIRHTALGRITMGERDGRKSERVSEIDALLTRAKIPHVISASIQKDLWGKLVWNSAFNPLSVLLNATVEEMLSNLASLSILKRAMAETALVAESEGHAISPKLIERYLDSTEQKGEFFTSMLQDYRKGRPLENEAISGAVVRAARRRGIAVPVNEMLFDVLRYLELKKEVSLFRRPS